MASFLIGPGREVTDAYDEWMRLREIAESGCVLVRPDGYVAWRGREVADDCTAALEAAMQAILAGAAAVAPATASG
jgi:2,4-dichlorophenol 6-monooxygenase